MGRKRSLVADKLAYFPLKVLALLALVLPRGVMLIIGSGIGWLFFTVLKLQRKRLRFSIDNMQNLYPEKSDEELTALLRKVCRHFGRFLMEGFMVPKLTLKKMEKLIRFEGLEHFRKALEQDKGVIFSTAHFGNFELANVAFALKGHPVWSVIREVDNKDIDILLDSMRHTSGLGIIKKEKAARDILKHLREKHIVTINIDQNAAFNNVFIPFFGKTAATFTTPAILGMRTGAPILPVLSFRDDATDTYRVRIYPIVEIEKTGDRGADIRLIMTHLTDILEEAIREAPEQWLWVHRRWKTEPLQTDIEAMKKETEIINSAKAEKKKKVGAV